MLTVVTLREIELVFAVLAELGLSREAVVIPLRPATPGRVELRPDGRVEVVFDSQMPAEAQMPGIRERLRAILATPAGARVKRADPAEGD